MAVFAPARTRPGFRFFAMAAVAAALAAVFTVVGATGRAAADHPDCEFVLGFASVQAMAPDTIGDCLDNEQHDPSDGITRQSTAGGVLLWDKATNWTAFTDGYQTWVNGPQGLQERLSIERFEWEPASIAVGATAEADGQTLAYVSEAIAAYERDGLEATVAHYNSEASIEGDRSLMMVDRSSLTLLAAPIFRNLVGSDGFELGKAIAAATEEGVWVEYLWPHPVTLQEAQKVTFAIRHDGRIFASGYYPAAEDPEANTMAYVQAAIDRYERDGLEATVAYYNSTESFDGASFLFLVDENDLYLVNPLIPQRIGTDVKLLTARGLDGMLYDFGIQVASVSEDGRWFHNLRPSAQGTGSATHVWVIRHDGLLFGSAYFDDE